MTKVSVFGCGHLGSIHVKLWKEQNAMLAGIYDIDKEKAREIANQHNCKAFSSREEAIEACDAATIATPTSDHFDTAIKLLEAGKHIFIEKPITAESSQASKLIELAKKKNLLIQVGHVERFNPAIAAISGREIKPMFIEAHRLSQFRPRAIDVSVVHDLMIHDIDIVLWLMKSPVTKIDANGVGVLTETIDIANARLNFENGAVANITASRISARPMRKMRIFQNSAYFSIDFGKPEVEVYQIKDSEDSELQPATMLGSIDVGPTKRNILFEKPEIPKINAIAEEQASFISAIERDKPAAVAAGEAAEALRIAEEITKIIKNSNI